MRVIKPFVMMLCVGLIVLSAPMVGKANAWNRETTMTFNQPIQVPGMTLEPGTYVFEVLDSPASNNVVQIFNADQTRLYENVLTIPAYRLKPTDQTVVTFEERAKATPEAMKVWFYPGNTSGQEFIYPKTNIRTAKVS